MRCFRGYFAYDFRLKREEWGVRVLPERRVQTSASHYRVVDVCVAAGESPIEAIIRTPPMLCIEILSRGRSHE